MRTWMRSLALLPGLVIAAAACEDGSTNPPAFDDPALLRDVALVAADGMFQDLAHMESTTLWAGVGFSPGPEGIELETHRSFKKTVTFFEDDEPQDRYDPVDTDSIHIVSELERVATHTFWSADIKRTRNMWITGLSGVETQRTWNGTGTSDVEKSRHPEGGAIREYDMTGTATIEDVVRGVPRSENPYPLSGTITRVMIVTRTVDGVSETREITSVITFNGTQLVEMDVNGTKFDVDLAEKGVRRRFQKKDG